eukprot:422472_1
MHNKLSRRYCPNMNQNVLRVIELFSGIGGFHLALKSLKLLKNYKFQIYPFDNNCNANKMYQHNFNIKPNSKNIEHLNSKHFDLIKPFIITLSPPCQPYTRAGIQKHSNDKRTNALHYFCQQILPKLKHLPNYIILENVIGFEISQSCQIFLQSIIKCGYKYKIYSINPTQIGIPNTRKRIYICAELNAKNINELNDYNFNGNDIPIDIITTIPIQNNIRNTIGNYINYKEEKYDNVSQKHLVLMDKIRKYKGYKFNIVTINDFNSECFTKAYATKKNYIKGTGSLFASKLRSKHEIMEFKIKYKQLCKDKNDSNHEEMMKLLSNIGLRYFTPKEMSLLMGFPLYFSFPNDMNDSQFYKLIGNSINVKVVGLLLNMCITKLM